MAERDVNDHTFDTYLDAVDRRLTGPRPVRASILDELRDGLHQAAAARRDTADPAAAAIAEFGTPAQVAAAFADELAGAQARRTARGYVLTGPPIGVLWVLALSAGGDPLDVIGPWRLVPPVPVLATAVLAAVLVLAGTGRASRWVRLPARRVADAGIVVVVATLIGDLLMLTVATRWLPEPLSLLAALAVTASAIRLGLGLPQIVRNQRSRRALVISQP
jgi:hypothetical protein